jgi:hypothetical protein
MLLVSVLYHLLQPTNEMKNKEPSNCCSFMMMINFLHNANKFLQTSYDLYCHSIARYYINYKLMKKMLKQYVQQTQIGGKDCEQILKEFSRILDDQVCRKQFSRSYLSILSLVPCITNFVSSIGVDRFG